MSWMQVHQREWRLYWQFKGLWLQLISLDVMLVVLFGLSGETNFSRAALLGLYWVMMVTLGVLLMPMAYREDEKVGLLDQLRLVASAYHIVWAKWLSASCMMLLIGGLLALCFGLFLNLSWSDAMAYLIFFSVSIPGIIMIGHCFELILLQEGYRPALMGLIWLPNALPYVLLSFFVLLSHELQSVYYAFALTLFWLAILPHLAVSQLKLKGASICHQPD